MQLATKGSVTIKILTIASYTVQNCSPASTLSQIAARGIHREWMLVDLQCNIPVKKKPFNQIANGKYMANEMRQ